MIDRAAHGDWSDFAGEVTFTEPTVIRVSTRGDMRTDKSGLLVSSKSIDHELA